MYPLNKSEMIYCNVEVKIPYNSFHILLVKTNYKKFSNLKRIEKKIEKRSIKPIIGFDREDMKTRLEETCTGTAKLLRKFQCSSHKSCETSSFFLFFSFSVS